MIGDDAVPRQGHSPAVWTCRVLWLVTIWAMSVLVLGVAATCLRLVMAVAGLVTA